MGNNRGSFRRFAQFAGCVGLAAVGLAAAASSFTTAESLDSRRARLEAMPLSERDRLMRNQQRFEQLPEGQQEQLRQLHQELERDPRCEQLKQVMYSYQEWLTTLPASQRAELQQLSIDERIEWIKKWQADVQRERSRHLEPSDIKAYFAWIEGRVLATLTDKERKALEAIKDDRLRRAMIRSHLEDPKGRLRLRAPTPEEIDKLKSSLSPAAQAALREARAAGNDGIRRLLYSWMAQSRRGLDELRMPNVKREELAKYFDSLSERDRDDYLALPPDQMWQRLEWRYLREQYSKDREGMPPVGLRPERRAEDTRPGGRGPLPGKPPPKARRKAAGAV